MISSRFFISLVFLILIPNLCRAADWPNFNLTKADPTQLPKSQTVTIGYDPVYKTAKQYQAYPLAEILNKIIVPDPLKAEQLVIVFTAADGYKASMAYSDAMTEQGFIAFKDNDAGINNWLEFKFGKQTMIPAPYYLVWPKKDLDEWRYPWPFQLVEISIQPAKVYFGAAAPPANADAQVNNGFMLFGRYCIRCHTVNLSGGKVGPELKNVTEYFKEQELAGFILNAAAYRPGTKMPAFNKIINTNDAQNIVRYLKQMASE